MIMFYVVLGIITRIISNSYLNVIQKILTINGNRPSRINFYTYAGLVFLSIFLLPFVHIYYSVELIAVFFIMGILGALGNYCIIKALSLGELSSITPINAYKPVISMVIAFLYLKECPHQTDIIGLILIIAGTYILFKNKHCINSKAIFYRFLALIFSGTEAVFIKKIIILTNIQTSFILWAISGLIFSAVFCINNNDNNNENKNSFAKYLVLLIIAVAIMQYSTNFLFSKINVSSALALFQLSTLLSVFMGVNIFHEKGLKRKIAASLIMIAGAVIIILG